MNEQLIKYKLDDYPALKASLENDKIVYLFGTGISSALTNKGYSWYKWIKDGAGYLPNDKRDEVLLKLEEDTTADHLVKVVGIVLELTKQFDVYDQWMKDSFESNPIEAMDLKNTLAKIPVTQDIIATTNYDLLLEEATGLEMNTYQEPDKIFKMLDDRHSSSVIHIHGAYSSKLDVYNIIADEKQYSDIYNNQGAQFIQNLLGTRTLIFVGCGQTSDDINISRFIRFAKEHLKLEIPYFFIAKEDNIPENLPDNFQVIIYGDAYSDLPVFLEEIVEHRLNHFMVKSPLVGRSHYQQSMNDKNGISKYHFAQEYIEFAGRKGELEELEKFIYCKQKGCWWAITGQAGSGKSRLAFELMKQMPNNWFSCFLNDAVDVTQVQDFKPFSNMLLVIDYVRGRENFIAEIMLLLSEIFSESSYQLRILMLERDGFVQYGSWYNGLYEKLGSNQKDKLKQLEYTSGIDDSNDLSLQPKTPFIKLVDLEEEAVLKLISQVCKMNGLPEDSARDMQLKEAYGRKLEKLQYRPLFVQIYVEAWIDNGCKQVEFNGYEGLLQLLLQKEQKIWTESVGNSTILLNSLIRLLIRASAGNGIDLNNLPEMYRSDWTSIKQFMKNSTAPGQQRKEHIDVLIRDVCQGLNSSELYMQPLYPDIVKEYMFEYYMEEEELQEVLDELWGNAGQEFGIYLQRCVTDFPESQFFWNVLELSKGKQLYNPYYLLARLGRLNYVDVKSKDAYWKMTNRLDVEFEFWSNIGIVSENQFEINMVKMKALQMLSFQYGGWMKLDKMQECTELLSECVSVKTDWEENNQNRTSAEGMEEDEDRCLSLVEESCFTGMFHGRGAMQCHSQG